MKHTKWVNVLFFKVVFFGTGTYTVSTPPPFPLSTGEQRSVPNFEKGGSRVRKKMSTWGDLRVPSTDICLDKMFLDKKTVHLS